METTAKKIGRPAAEVQNERLTVMLPPDMISQIKVLAKQKRQSYSAVIEQFVEAGLADLAGTKSI